MPAAGATVAPARAAQILERAAQARAVVLGDMMVDEHLIGEVRRLAREAPLPVIEERERRLVPGGATNTAANLRGLGCSAAVAGVVGADAMAERLGAELTRRGIQADGLVRDPSRTTAVKLRVWAGGDRQRTQHMVARIDSLDSSEVSPHAAAQLTTYLAHAVPAADALIISDYEAGVLSPPVLSAALTAARAADLIVTADAHGGLARFGGATLLTPNQPEAEAELGRTIDSTADALDAAAELRRRVGVDAVLITLGEAGMALDAADGARIVVPADRSIRVADPTGAGDTVAAAMTAALLGGASPAEAAALAGLAARIVVRQLGAAVVTSGELVREAHGAHV